MTRSPTAKDVLYEYNYVKSIPELGESHRAYEHLPKARNNKVTDHIALFIDYTGSRWEK